MAFGHQHSFEPSDCGSRYRSCRLLCTLAFQAAVRHFSSIQVKLQVQIERYNCLQIPTKLDAGVVGCCQLVAHLDLKRNVKQHNLTSPASCGLQEETWLCKTVEQRPLVNLTSLEHSPAVKALTQLCNMLQQPPSSAFSMLDGALAILF